MNKTTGKEKRRNMTSGVGQRGLDLGRKTRRKSSMEAPFQSYFCGICQSYVSEKRDRAWSNNGQFKISVILSTGDGPSFPKREILIALIEREFPWIFESKLQWSLDNIMDHFFPRVISLGHKASHRLEGHSSLSLYLGSLVPFSLTSVSPLIRHEVLLTPHDGVYIVLIL